MTTTTTSSFNPASVEGPAAPRGAGWVDSLLARLWARARREMTRSEEAAQVREMARHMQATDPGFASDLLAAADRHERVGR